MTQQEIRTAAEVLLTGSSSSFQTSQPSTTQQINHSINSQVEPLSPEDLITGSRHGGRMSVVRRFFCLFVTFDLLFTILMWLICIMLSGTDVFSALSKEIVHYNIHTSLFDIVMAAACRFVVLLLFYALLYMNHWCIIALSTTATCSFLIAKVFVFDWPGAHSPVFQVLLILTSFVLAWGEAWFLDFRVIPQETQALQFLQNASLCSDSERTPLLRHFLQGLPRYDDHQESVRNFYSPMESLRGSDDEGEPSSQRDHFIPKEEPDHKRRAREILETAWKLLNSPDWRLERKTVQGDIIQSKLVPQMGKIYRLTGTVNLPPKMLLDQLYYKIEEIPSWNPTLVESKCIQVVDEHTDIMYQVIAEGGGGIVASRDFVDLRHLALVDGCYVAAAASISHPDKPPSTKYIRGKNGPCCWVMRPLVGESESCTFQWLLNTNLQGWIPQSVVDLALSNAMSDYMIHLRERTKDLNQNTVP